QNSQHRKRREQTVITHAAGFGSGHFRMPRHVTDCEDGRDQRGNEEGVEHELRESVDVTQQYASRREMAIHILVEIVRQIRENEKKRRAYDEQREDAHKFTCDVTIENTSADHGRLFFHGVNTPRTDVARSDQPPPRAVDVSRPIRINPQTLNSRNRRFGAHGPQKGATLPLSPSDSPPINDM